MSDYSGPIYVALLWCVYLALGGVGALVSYRAAAAYRARRSRPFLFLAAGLSLVTVGTPATWMGAYALTQDMYLCTLSSTIAAVVGVGVLLASIQSRAG